MNKGFLQSSSWSSMNNQAPTSSSSSSSSLAMSLWHDDSRQEQDLLPVSWSQLLLGGSPMSDFQTKKLVVDDEEVGNWEDQMAAYNASAAAPERGYEYGSEEIKQLAEAAARVSWCQMNSNVNQAAAAACATANFGSNNMLDFSNSKAECNSKETGGAAKKIKVAQPTFKVRKEKLGDRIAVLHQLVSPFGKTDTASVLLEAIGYIRFLQNQIEALSSPYLGSGGSDCTTQPGVKRRNCIFPEDPGQVDGGELKDLRSRGLCLVPLSTCTSHVGGDAGADHWAASLAAGFL